MIIWFVQHHCCADHEQQVERLGCGVVICIVFQVSQLVGPDTVSPPKLFALVSSELVD